MATENLKESALKRVQRFTPAMVCHSRPGLLTFWPQIKCVYRTHRATFLRQVWWSWLISFRDIVQKNRLTHRANGDKNATQRLLYSWVTKLIKVKPTAVVVVRWKSTTNHSTSTQCCSGLVAVWPGVIYEIPRSNPNMISCIYHKSHWDIWSSVQAPHTHHTCCST